MARRIRAAASSALTAATPPTIAIPMYPSEVHHELRVFTRSEKYTATHLLSLSCRSERLGSVPEGSLALYRVAKLKAVECLVKWSSHAAENTYR